MKGSYFRLGIKTRYPVTPRNQTNALWFQVLGTYSSYEMSIYDKRDSSTKNTNDAGLGLTIATGCDFKFAKHFDFRLGVQTGILPNFSNGTPSLTPGFGWAPIPIQLVIGLNFRFSIFEK